MSRQFNDAIRYPTHKAPTRKISTGRRRMFKNQGHDVRAICRTWHAVLCRTFAGCGAINGSAPLSAPIRCSASATAAVMASSAAPRCLLDAAAAAWAAAAGPGSTR